MNMTTNQDHWQTVYQAKSEQQTSWFRPHLDESLRLIDSLGLDKTLPVIDVGGGRSTLVDDLLARGYGDITALDLSQAALDQSRQRLGDRGASVAWIATDITQATLPATHYGLWHDRAVFHFLTDPGERARYAMLAARSMRADGYIVLATFAADGPEKCSGLPVCRYDADELAAVFAQDFERVADSRERHPTPFGTEQPFTYVVLRRNANSVRTAHETSDNVRSAHATE
jgi:SAM-dependent methyltransferase